MKSSVKREKKKYPYHRNKHSIFTQIKARERRIKEKLPNYAIVDSKGKIIDKYRLKGAADNDIIQIQKNYYERLKVVPLDDEGNVTT